MCCLFLAASSTVAIAQTSVVDLVNPIIGTNGMGHTFPGACVPFGLVQLSPDTDTIPHNVDGKYQPRSYEYCAGYQHKDSSIVGFSHTHFSGTGHSDLGDILIMPTTGTLKLNPGTATNPDGGYRSRFSHGTEISRPGYYEVMLTDYGVKAQLTTTQRVGIHKYTYPTNSENQRIILDMIHGIYNYDGKVLLDQYSRRERYAGNRLSYHKRMGAYQLYLLCHVFLQTGRSLRMRGKSKS